MDVHIAVLTPLPKPTQSSESRSVQKKHMTRTSVSLSTVGTYMLFGGHILKHA